jgi:hypothetical protein
MSRLDERVTSSAGDDLEGVSLPPTLSTREVAELLNQSVSTVERYAADGLFPTLVRRGTGAPWRIITARLLIEHLGYSRDQVAAIVRFPLQGHRTSSDSALSVADVARRAR